MNHAKIKVGSSIDELFFIISPPGHIKSDVSVLKDDVQYLIGHRFEDRHAKAHVSLFKFDVEQHFEDITKHVEEVAAHFSPFNIFIKDLNVFHNGASRTIFLDIVNKYPVRDILEKLVRKDVQYTPNITIAKNLTAEDFLKAWPYLKDLPYSQHFLCDRITVLARIEEKWITYKEILFGA
ncbi:MAG TPA: 2'-5' RNA ligase family protein [Chryseolinea sp.]|nr:2'-5' RNA ligase family protein [Chryseolinea sp.]